LEGGGCDSSAASYASLVEDYHPSLSG